MPSSKSTYDLPSGAPSPVVKEEHIEYGFIGKLQNLKYEYRDDIRDRAALEKNFREKFEALNRVKLTQAEFARLLDEIVTPDVYTAAKTLRGINAFILAKHDAATGGRRLSWRQRRLSLPPYLLPQHERPGSLHHRKRAQPDEAARAGADRPAAAVGDVGAL